MRSVCLKRLDVGNLRAVHKGRAGLADRVWASALYCSTAVAWRMCTSHRPGAQIELRFRCDIFCGAVILEIHRDEGSWKVFLIVFDP